MWYSKFCVIISAVFTATSPGIDSTSRNHSLCSSVRSRSSSVRILSWDCSHSVFSLRFRLFFCSFLTSLSPHIIEESGPYSGLGFGLRECCSWFWSSIYTTTAFFISAIRPFCFLILHVFMRVALLISFTNFAFASITRLTVWSRGL